jgi:hypothetical protein
MAMKQRLSHSRLFARNERESRYRRDAEQNTEYIAGGDIVEANVRTFFADCNWRQQRLSEQEYESFWTGELPPSWYNLPGLASTPDSLLYHEGVWVVYSLYTLHRRLMISEKGYISLVPIDCRSGDRICVLSGCSIPVILRQKGDYHILIGECYVHGIMDGQAIQQLREGKYRVENFKLEWRHYTVLRKERMPSCRLMYRLVGRG